MSWIIGRSAGSTQPSLGRVSLSLHSYQNPQFGMTINKISPSAHPTSRKTIHWIVLLGRVTRGEGIKPPPRNQRFRSSRKGWTFCAFSLLFTPSAIRHAVSRGSYFAGSTSVPTPPPRRREGKITVTPSLIREWKLNTLQTNNIKPSPQLSTKKYLNFLKKYYIMY